MTSNNSIVIILVSILLAMVLLPMVGAYTMMLLG